MSKKMDEYEKEGKKPSGPFVLAALCREKDKQIIKLEAELKALREGKGGLPIRPENARL